MAVFVCYAPYCPDLVADKMAVLCIIRIVFYFVLYLYYVLSYPVSYEAYKWDERVGIIVTFPTVSWDLSECYPFEFGEGVPLSGSPSRSAGSMYDVSNRTVLYNTCIVFVLCIVIPCYC